MVSARLGRTNTPRRKTIACISSCFSAPTDFDTDDYKPATHANSSSRKTSRLFSWSRFRDKKKTVPVDIESHRELAPEPTPIMDKAQLNTENQQQTAEEAPNTKPCIFQQMSSNWVRQTTQPSPLRRMPNSAHTSITTRRLGSPSRAISSFSSTKSNKKCEFMALAYEKLNTDSGAIVLTMTLLALLLFGRAFAVVCISVRFYLIPRLGTDRRTTTVTGTPKKKLKRADVGELSKTVVTQG